MRCNRNCFEVKRTGPTGAFCARLTEPLEAEDGWPLKCKSCLEVEGAR